ncbi:hypothetical protein HZB88_05580 [archaeon]|nr:hypothetical protein [archaeon]
MEGKLLKLPICILLLLFLAGIVFAGQSQDIDFASNPVQVITLGIGDEARFNLLNAQHNILLKDISKSLTSLKIGVTPFIPGPIQIGIVGIDQVMKVDLNKDGYDDISIDVLEIPTNSSATLILLDTSQRSAELISSAAVAGQEGEEAIGKAEYKKPLIYIGAVLIILIIILAVRKIKYSVLRSKGREMLEESGRMKKEGAETFK